MQASAHVIVLGNEKGGSGKTTTSVHIIIALLKEGFKVGSIDIDARQKSLTHYINNRKRTAEKHDISLLCPDHGIVEKSDKQTTQESEQDEKIRFDAVFKPMLNTCDFVVIDSPGNDTHLSRYAHSFADTVVTPINDSFVDLDVLAQIDGETFEVKQPSIYSEMLWQQKMEKLKREKKKMDWVVMRNRLPAIHSKNRARMGEVLDALAKRIGFRVASAFGERVIFRELFLQGLTVLDTLEMPDKFKPSMSHVSARQEVRKLLAALELKQLEIATKEKKVEVA